MRRLPLILVAFPLLVACGTARLPEPVWESSVVLATGGKLGGCAVGDVDPSGLTVEIVAVAADGSVHVVRRGAGGWVGVVAAHFEGEGIQCAVGDADPTHPGAEIAVVGMKAGGEDSEGPGAAHVIRRGGDGGWESETIFEDSALLHAVAIGAGEVFVGGFSNTAHRLVRGDSGWTSEKIADLPGAAKSAVTIGRDVAFACTDGSVVRVRRELDGWSSEVVDKRPAGRARVGSDGRRLIVADDDGTLSLLANGERTELLHETEKLRGAVLAQLDPAGEGLEAATAGYGRAVTILRRVEDAWFATEIYASSERLHHLVAADVDPAPGSELITCGFAGELVMLRRVR